MSSIISKIIFYWSGAPIWLVMLVTLVPIVIWACLLIRLKTRTLEIVGVTIATITILSILYTTIFSRTVGAQQDKNLLPFSFIIRGIEHPVIYREYWMNVYLFIPLGMSLPIVLKSKPWIVVFIGFCISVTVEVIQYFFALGLCEADDVIANTLGCAIGVFVYFVAMRIRQTGK